MPQPNDLLNLLNDHIGGSTWFVFLLLGTGVFYTIYLGFPQIRFFRHAVRCVLGRYDKKEDEGDTSHFQALSTALSGTVGTGNIGGVALAVHLGGPAALFWMLTTAFLGMTTKFVEVSLSHKYREKAEDGSIAGGPMYYMKNKLNLKWLAAIFAFSTVLSSFGTGNMPQVNNIATSMFATFGINPMLTGGVLAVILGFVIIGGIKRIARITEKLVPGMAIIYFLGAFAVIFYNYDTIVPSFISVFSDVLTGSAAGGGFLGAGFAYAFNRGVNRGLFSNEAGQGSAPIAHAAARAHEPISEGLVAILEPFIDTIVICTVTGLVLLSSGVWNEKLENKFQYADLQIVSDTYSEDNKEQVESLFHHLSGRGTVPTFTGKLQVMDGIITNQVTVIHARSIAEDVRIYRDKQPFSGSIDVYNGAVQDTDYLYIWMGSSLIHSAALTTEAFKRGLLGDFGQYIVAIGLLLFAFSTAISWSYYGDRAVTYLWGIKYVNYYRAVYVVGFFLASFTDTTIIWTISGITIALMTIPNLVGILLLHRDMKTTLKDYWADFKKEWPDEATPE